MNSKNIRRSTKTLVLGAMLTALVVLLQLLGQFIHVGSIFSISLVLIPIVVGAITCGVKVGAWLGLVFSVVVLFQPDTSFFYAFSIPGTVITVIVKGVLCGVSAALVYKCLERSNKYVAVIGAALICPIVNTGIFTLGCFVFFFEDLSLQASGLGYNGAVAFIFIGLIGLNFIAELVTNIVLAPVIIRLIDLVKKDA